MCVVWFKCQLAFGNNYIYMFCKRGYAQVLDSRGLYMYCYNSTVHTLATSYLLLIYNRFSIIIDILLAHDLVIA